MMRPLLSLIIALTAATAQAETVLAARTLRANTIIVAADLTLAERDAPGGLRSMAEAIGMEARVVLYAGRPIKYGDIAPPAIVGRNQVVPLVFHAGNLRIVTEGRALGRGAAGDVIRIMNLASRTTVSGRIAADGSVLVSN